MADRRADGGWHNFLPDTGCDVSPKCVACPLPQCKYEVRGGLRAQARTERNVQIREAYQMRAPVDEIRAAFGVSRRQTFRILQA